MTTYTPLADATLAQDKPWTQSISRAVRDNPLAIAEATSGAPSILALNPESVTSVTSAAQLAVLSLPALERLELEVNGIKPATSNAVLRVQVSVNNGSSWIGGTGYHYVKQLINTAGTVSTVGLAGSSNIELTATNHSNNNTVDGTVTLINVNSSSRTTGLYKLGYATSGGVYVWVSGMFVIEGAGAAINAIRFFFDTGNVATGKVTVRRFRPTVAN